MNRTDRPTSTGRPRRLAALAAMLTVTLAAAAQCGGGAQACASHGGLRDCKDGHNIGAGS